MKLKVDNIGTLNKTPIARSYSSALIIKNVHALHPFSLPLFHHLLPRSLPCDEVTDCTLVTYLN